MTVTITEPAVAGLVDALANAAPDRLDAEFQRLVGALWTDGDLTALALPAVPVLVAELDRVGADRQGHLAVLLGLLAEAEYPATDGPVTAAVRAGLNRYLDLLDGGASDAPLTLALLYLLAHLPDDADRILAAAAPLALDADDRSRLERALAPLDPAAPDLGRCWPSPSVWVLDAEERRFDQERIAG